MGFPIVDKYKYLGIFINKYLTWEHNNEQKEEKLAKIKKTINIM